jgi:hypothetical protein
MCSRVIQTRKQVAQREHGAESGLNQKTQTTKTNIVVKSSDRKLHRDQKNRFKNYIKTKLIIFLLIDRHHSCFLFLKIVIRDINKIKVIKLHSDKILIESMCSLILVACSRFIKSIKSDSNLIDCETNVS